MLRFLLPALVLTAALAAAAGWLGELPAEPALLHLARALLAAVFLLAWRFRRGRVAWLAASLALAQEALRSGEALGGLSAPAAALLLPLHVAAAGYLAEWRLLTTASAPRFAVFALEALAVAILSHPAAAAAAARLRGPLVELPWPGAGLPQAALAAFGLAALLLLARLGWRREPLEASLPAVLVAALLAAGGERPALFFATAALILALALVESAFSLAFEDGLTGLPGRRALEEALLDLGGTYAVAMVDVDRFKRLNDRHGHEVGDQVLRLIGRLLARVGGGGAAYRYGGEEFAVLFPGRSAAKAEPHLDELRRAVASYPFAVRGADRPRSPAKAPPRGRGPRGKPLRVTVSLGLAGPGGARHTPRQVLKAADRALYRSKKGGRNRLTRVR